MDEYVIGLDASTNAVKAALFDSHGNEIYAVKNSYVLNSPGPGLYEQNPEDWWRAACGALQELVGTVSPEQIKALSISNQRETFVPLDGKGLALRPAIIWLDERCKKEVQPFAALTGVNAIHEISGKPADFAPIVYRLAWMKKHEPELFYKTSMFSDVHSYLSLKLTGTFRTSTASADPWGLYDMKHGCWSEKLMQLLELDSARLPEPVLPGTVIGTISSAVAAVTGLSENTILVAGGGDGQVAGLGVNAQVPQRAYLNLGTAVVAGIFGTQYLAHRAFRTMHACSGSGFYYECSLRAGTFTVDWFVSKLANCNQGTTAKPTGPADFDLQAQNIPPGSNGVMFLPYLSGAMNPYWDDSARGAFIGLSPAHSAVDMYRAVLEGIAYEIAFELLETENATGIKVRELALIGGGSASSIWRTIIANVTGKDLLLFHNSEASCLGAGICAAVGSGLYGDFKEAAAAMVHVREIIKPDDAISGIYSKLSETYRRIYPALKGINFQINSIVYISSFSG